MKSSILNEQRTIQAKSDVFWTMQLTRDILRDIWQKTTKKLLAIVEALTKCRQYLLDATEKFKVWTNHKNFKYFSENYINSINNE